VYKFRIPIFLVISEKAEYHKQRKAYDRFKIKSRDDDQCVLILAAVIAQLRDSIRSVAS